MDTSINLRLHFVLLLLLYGLDVCFQISDPNQILAWSVKERSPDRHITRAVRTAANSEMQDCQEMASWEFPVVVLSQHREIWGRSLERRRLARLPFR